jgi:hypothetical protein
VSGTSKDEKICLLLVIELKSKKCDENKGNAKISLGKIAGGFLEVLIEF